MSADEPFPFTARSHAVQEHEVQVLTCAGALDITTAETLRAAVRGLSAEKLVIDLTDVAFMDSTGLAALVAAHRRYPRRRLAICCPPGAPRGVLALNGLDELFLVHDSVAAAASALGGG